MTLRTSASASTENKKISQTFHYCYSLNLQQIKQSEILVHHCDFPDNKGEF